MMRDPLVPIARAQRVQLTMRRLLHHCSEHYCHSWCQLISNTLTHNIIYTAIFQPYTYYTQCQALPGQDIEAHNLKYRS